MEDTTTGVGAQQELRSQIESLMVNHGLQCSQCVIAVLGEQLGPGARALEGAALPLGRGMAGTGGLCGALTGGLLALGAAFESDRPVPPGTQPAPLTFLTERLPNNDWLDAQSAVGVQPPVFSLCRDLMAEFSGAYETEDGSVSCAELSGVDWSAPTREQLARYYAPGGELSRCVEMIGSVASRVRELMERTPAGTT